MWSPTMTTEKTKSLLRPRSSQAPLRPTLRFSPTAWAKLLYLRDCGPTEVGGFGISAANDLFYIEDIFLVRQVCTAVSVVFEDASVADLFDGQVDRGLRPEQFARIWVHTHPGNCPQPSWMDEDTFARVFGAADWAVMFILARGGQSYARLRFNVGPGGAVEVPVAVDYGRPFPASDFDAWYEEFLANVSEPVMPAAFGLAEADPPFGAPELIPELWDEFPGDELGFLTSENLEW